MHDEADDSIDDADDAYAPPSPKIQTHGRLPGRGLDHRRLVERHLELRELRRRIGDWDLDAAQDQESA
jgi:hypothetical protein